LRYFVELSYNGKNYHGWQRQPNAISVQEVVENTLSKVIREDLAIVGCGRTDTGVHASQFFLHFDVDEVLNLESLIFKLNSCLPVDIAIHDIFKVSDKDHARFSATFRSYEYRIFLNKNPFYNDTTWQVYNQKYDLKIMNEAAKILFEYTNFKCFSRSRTDVKTYNCKIMHAEWIQENDLLVFHIKADRFLRNMVRAIVGTLLQIGQYKINLQDFRRIIESEDRTQAGASVKAKGLFLTQVGYPTKVLSNYGK
jgi:tRNA pseudouridine38-40 synthase